MPPTFGQRQTGRLAQPGSVWDRRPTLVRDGLCRHEAERQHGSLARGFTPPNVTGLRCIRTCQLEILSNDAIALRCRIERWPIAGSFTISRGAKTEAVVVIAEISRSGHTGRGECVPYARYGRRRKGFSLPSSGCRSPRSRPGSPITRVRHASCGRANALDCALWISTKCGPRIWTLLSFGALSSLHGLYNLTRLA